MGLRRDVLQSIHPDGSWGVPHNGLNEARGAELVEQRA